MAARVTGAGVFVDAGACAAPPGAAAFAPAAFRLLVLLSPQ